MPEHPRDPHKTGDVMKRITALILLIVLLACQGGSGEGSSLFEYAFTQHLGTYDQYYLIDMDAHTAVYFTTADDTVSAWRFRGDFDVFLTIDMGGGRYDLFYQRNADTAILRDSYDTEWEYAPADLCEAQDLLTQKGYHYDPEEHYIRIVEITEGCNARKKPEYSAASIKWVKEGETFEYLKTKDRWYKIRFENGAEAYVPMERSKMVVY